jgi:hypothetical protein
LALPPSGVPPRLQRAGVPEGSPLAIRSIAFAGATRRRSGESSGATVPVQVGEVD